MRETVAEIVRNHHYNRAPAGVPPEAFFAVRLADWIASNYREEDAEGVEDRAPSTILRSPFPLEGEQGGITHGSTNLGECMKGLWVQTPCSGTSTVESCILALLNQIYLKHFTTPDDVRNNHIPLPVHLHVVAALSSALVSNPVFRRIAAQSQDYHRLLRALQDAPEEIQLSFVTVSIHRIQRFILPEHGRPTRALALAAGRSLLVNTLLHALAYILAHRWGYSPANVLIAGGGHALLLVSKPEDDLKDLSVLITADLWRAGIPLVVTLHEHSFDVRDAVKGILGGVEPPSATLQRALNRLHEAIRNDVLGQWVEAQVANDVLSKKPHERCPLCGFPKMDGIRITKGDSELQGVGACNACLAAREMSKILRDGYANRWELEVLGYTIGVEGDTLTVYEENEAFLSAKIGKYEPIPRPACTQRVEDEEGSHIQTLEEIGHVYTVVKGDGDSVGKLTGELLKTSLTWYLAFSKALTRFFERCLPDIAGKHHVHLVYAGGDDFLAVGSLPGALDFLKTFYENFVNYKGNVNLLPTVSVALRVVPAKYKIAYAIREVTELLHTAKKGGGNGFCVQTGNTVGKFSKIRTYVEESSKLFNEIRDEKRAAFQKALQILVELQQIRKNSKEFVRRYGHAYRVLTSLGAAGRILREAMKKLLERAPPADEFVVFTLTYLRTLERGGE